MRLILNGTDWAMLRAGINMFRAGCPSLRKGLFPTGVKSGQTVVEYLLMMAVVVGIILLLIAAFHKQILGGIFTIAGLVLGND